MRIFRIALLHPLIFLHLAALSADAGAIAISSELTLGVAARAGTTSQADVVARFQNATIDPLFANLEVTTTEPASGSTSTARGDLSLVFADASSGVFFFQGLGWETMFVDDGDASVSAVAAYNFQVDGAGQILTVAHAAEVVGTDLFGLGDYFVTLSSVLGIDTREVDLTGSDTAVGVFEFVLQDGIAYELSIEAGPAITGELGTRMALGNGTFAFNIVQAVVPEPSSLAMAGSSVLVVAGLALFRRRLA